jgi:outer membrane protein
MTTTHTIPGPEGPGYAEKVPPALKSSQPWRGFLRIARPFRTGIGLFACAFAPVGAQAQAAGGLTLAQVTASALQVSPSVSIAQQTLAQARARLGQAQAGRRYQITFNSVASVSNGSIYQGPPSQETFGSLQNTLTIPLPFNPRLNALQRQAQAQLDAAQSQFAAARLTAAGQAQTAYFDLLKQRALLKTARENAAQAQAALQVAQKRYQDGVAPQLDILKAQVPAATAEAAVTQAESQVAVSSQTLNNLLGQPLDGEPSVADIAASPALTLSLNDARQQAVAASADVRAAQSNIQAAEAGLAAARLTRVPEFALQASDTRSKDVTGFGRLDTAQISVTLPLSDGGLARAQIQEADAVLMSSQTSLIQAKQTAALTAGTAYVTAQGALAQIAPTQTAVEIAQTTLAKTQEGYQAGLNPIIDVLNTQLALNQARIAHARAVYDAAAALATLNRALGKELP